jgi:hypothetical protein
MEQLPETESPMAGFKDLVKSMVRDNIKKQQEVDLL